MRPTKLERLGTRLQKQAHDMGKSHGRRGSITVLQNFNATVFHIYIPYNDLNHYKKTKTRPDTRPIPVADGWAGAEMHVFQLDHHGPTNRPTNQATNQRTDGQSLLL